MITATDQPATRDPSRGYLDFEKKKKVYCGGGDRKLIGAAGKPNPEILK